MALSSMCKDIRPWMSVSEGNVHIIVTNDNQLAGDLLFSANDWFKLIHREAPNCPKC